MIQELASALRSVREKLSEIKEVLDDRYDVDEDASGWRREFPFGGAGRMMTEIEEEIRKIDALLYGLDAVLSGRPE